MEYGFKFFAVCSGLILVLVGLYGLHRIQTGPLNRPKRNKAQ